MLLFTYDNLAASICALLILSVNNEFCFGLESLVLVQLYEVVIPQWIIRKKGTLFGCHTIIVLNHNLS